ncbi:MAG: hypothetical protein JNL34_17305 [Anaerolineae bacterium]|nr:hypothetical protein [Anaerolineae bacterium]
MFRFGSAALFSLVVLAAGLAPVAAQSCSAEATQALDQVGVNCAGLSDNAACYGHNGVVAAFNEPVQFSAPGHIAPLPPLQTIQTLPYNPENGEWGIAVLRLQANLPGTLPGQTTTLLLMGDMKVAAVENAVAPMQAFNLRVGVGQAQCQGLPPSSITINGPQRASLDLTVNGASMRLGSSVTIRETPDGRLRFIVTAGRLEIENGPIIPVGFATSVNLDDNGDIMDDSWDEVGPMSFEEWEELSPLEELPEDVLGEEFPLPSEEEIALLDALDFDMLLELDPYLALALAEDWAASGILPEDLDGMTLDDVEAYVLDNISWFAGDEDALEAIGASFGLDDETLAGFADELGLELNAEDVAGEEDLTDEGELTGEDDADAVDDGGQSVDDAAPPDDGGGEGQGDGGEG